MKLLDIDDLAADFREVQITIDLPELYAEIVEVYKARENGPGFVIVTSVMVIEPQFSSKQDISANLRRLEL